MAQKTGYPQNRAFVQSFLAKLGLNVNDTKGIIDICKGLSLNDCYWIVDDAFIGSFDKFNLYDNRFNRILSLIAYTGYGDTQRSGFVSTPELTTDGMLAKCWRRESGKDNPLQGQVLPVWPIQAMSRIPSFMHFNLPRQWD